MHFCQRLAPNSVAALEVCLVLGEVHRSPRQGTFLQHPTALVQRTLDNVAVEVIDSLADIEGLVLIEGDEFALRSRPKKSVSLIASPTGSDDAVRSAVDIFHPLRLVREVAIRALDDAYRVYPQVRNVQLPSTVYCILEGLWQVRIWDRNLEAREVTACPIRVILNGGEGLVSFGITPRM